MKKFLVATVIGLLSLQTLNLTEVYAQEIGSTYENEITEEGDKIQRADVIEYRYRTYNGVNQFRRWNATQNRWVDPAWINLI